MDRLNPNPSYKHSLVVGWLIEFDDDGNPWREIALGLAGNPVFSGPNNEDYGYWLDTNMKFDDFSGTEILADEFNEQWAACGSMDGGGA